jgi:hypothetical protein
VKRHHAALEVPDGIEPAGLDFLEGFQGWVAQLPPPAASEKESVLTQAKHALQKDKGPPRAQPPKTEPRRGKK